MRSPAATALLLPSLVMMVLTTAGCAICDGCQDPFCDEPPLSSGPLTIDAASGGSVTYLGG